MTKASLQSLSQRISYSLRNKYGVGTSGPNKDVVTVISYGQPMVAAAFFGIIGAGGVYSAASPSSTVSELVRQITIAKSRWIICGIEFKDVVTQAAKQSNLSLSQVLILESRPNWSLNCLEDNSSAISDHALGWQHITDVKALQQSLIIILWSSGTTDLPKGEL